MPVSFAPTNSGSLTGALILTDNNLNASSPAYATQSAALSGTGVVVPSALTSPTPGSQLASSSVTFNWTVGAGVTNYWFNLGTAASGATRRTSMAPAQ